MSEEAESATQAKTKAVTVASASDVRSGWYVYLNRVRQAGETIVITRYGKPVAKLCPMEDPVERCGIFGWLAGTVTVHGDIIAPLAERWGADA